MRLEQRIDAVALCASGIEAWPKQVVGHLSQRITRAERQQAGGMVNVLGRDDPRRVERATGRGLKADAVGDSRRQRERAAAHRTLGEIRAAIPARSQRRRHPEEAANSPRRAPLVVDDELANGGVILEQGADRRRRHDVDGAGLGEMREQRCREHHVAKEGGLDDE